MSIRYSVQDYIVHTAEGTDLPNQPMLGTIEECKTACTNNQNCIEFGRAKADGDSIKSYCWLKKSNKNKTPKQNFHTYVKESSFNFKNSLKKIPFSVYIILAIILILIIVYMNRNRFKNNFN